MLIFSQRSPALLPTHLLAQSQQPPTFCHAVPRTLEVLLNLSLLPWGPVLTTITIFYGGSLGSICDQGLVLCDSFVLD